VDRELARAAAKSRGGRRSQAGESEEGGRGFRILGLPFTRGLFWRGGLKFFTDGRCNPYKA
jgi:hypothetical protein